MLRMWRNTPQMDPRRHSAVFNPDAWGDRPVKIIGTTPAAASAALHIAKLCVSNIEIIDDTPVSEEELPSLPYRSFASAGNPRADALSRFIEHQTRTRPSVRTVIPDDPGDLEGVLFLSLDRQELRESLFHDTVELEWGIPLLIEPRHRTGASSVYAIDPRSPVESVLYGETLSEAEVSTLPFSSVETTSLGALSALQFIRAEKDRKNAAVEENRGREVMVDIVRGRFFEREPEPLPSGLIRRPMEFDLAAFMEQEIHIIGAGALGSWAAMHFASLGCRKLHIWDFDRVEAHNVCNQAYGISDVGRLKADSLAAHILESYGVEAYPHLEKFTGKQALSGIVIVLTDTMSSRRAVFESVRGRDTVHALLEARLGTDEGRVYSIDPRNDTECRAYEGTLYDDKETSEASACGAVTTVGPSAHFLSSLTVGQVVRRFESENARAEECDNELLVSFWPSGLYQGNFRKE